VAVADEPAPVREPVERCSIPLLTLVPQTVPPMPAINPKSFVTSKRFYVKPPAPPCETPAPIPLGPVRKLERRLAPAFPERRP
jgi:hypothetical protein